MRGPMTIIHCNNNKTRSFQCMCLLKCNLGTLSHCFHLWMMPSWRNNIKRKMWSGVQHCPSRVIMRRRFSSAVSIIIASCLLKAMLGLPHRQSRGNLSILNRHPQGNQMRKIKWLRRKVSLNLETVKGTRLYKNLLNSINCLNLETAITEVKVEA